MKSKHDILEISILWKNVKSKVLNIETKSHCAHAHMYTYI